MCSQYELKWMIRRDMPAVLDIEKQSCEFPLDESDIVAILRKRDCIGMVLELNDEVVGFVIYKLSSKSIEILDIAIHPKYRRSGLGKAIVDKLKSKLCWNRRNAIDFTVLETNLTALKFFRELGFRAVNLVKKPYLETDRDGIYMRYRVNARVVV